MNSATAPGSYTGTTLCGYCGMAYSIVHGHACYPTAVAASTSQSFGTFVIPEHLCPDLLRYEQIGAADGLRGRVVRGVFWLLRAWPPRR